MIINPYVYAAPASNGLLTGLTAYYKGDDAAGANLADSIAGNHFTQHFSPGSGTGRITLARDLESGSLQYFNRADDATFSLGSDTDFTWFGWFNFESVTVTDVLFNKGPITGAGDEWLLWVGNDSGTPRLEVYIGNGTTAANKIATSSTIPTGAWTFAAISHNKTTDIVTLRQNATEYTASWSGGTQNTAYSPTIGSESSGGRYFDGLLCEIGFYNGRCLSTADLDLIYGGGSGLPLASYS